MSKDTLDGIIEHLRQELDLTKVKARELGNRFEALRREMESIKVDTLLDFVDGQRKSAALGRGIAYMIKDKKRLRNSLLVSAGGVVLGGLLTKDKLGAITAGMSLFDGMAQGFGERKWCVLLGKRIAVVPEETVSPQVSWMTLASFHKTMEEFEEGALAGDRLGNLDDIMSKLKKKPR